MIRSNSDPKKTITTQEMREFVDALVSNEEKKKSVVQDSIRIKKDFNLKSTELQKIYSTNSFSKRIVKLGSRKTKSFGYCEAEPPTKRIKR